MLYQEPKVSSTPGKNGFTVTAIQCSGHVTWSHHEYTLSTTVTYSPDWLLQNSSPPMEPVRTALIQYKWPEHWLALMPKPVFQVLRSLTHLGRSSLMCKNVSRWSQSALFTITVGSENLYLWLYLFIYFWFSINSQNTDLPLWHNRFSRCWGAFWSLVEHLSWAKWCPRGISHHSVLL